jgi:hypothetical protein
MTCKSAFVCLDASAELFFFKLFPCDYFENIGKLAIANFWARIRTFDIQDTKQVSFPQYHSNL